MAVALQAKAKASIQAPVWMQAGVLEETLRKERESEADFQPLPFHYIEIATALFKHAGECFGEHRQRIEELVDSLRSVRFNKVEKGLRRLDGAGAAYIRLNNVAAMEINIVRPFLVTALNRFAQHAALEVTAEKGALAAAAGAASAGAAAAESRPRRQLRR